MSEYTAEDFKNARFAEHRHGAKAVRWEMNYRIPWHTATGDRFSDEQMAENGWRPVREHSPHATDDLEELVGDLRDEVRDLRLRLKESATRTRVLSRTIDEQERTMAALNTLTAPLTLDSLREAWENAEVTTDATPLRRGDTAITQIRPDTYTVGAVLATMTGEAPSDVRVLHRAPQPEPWQALADVLGGVMLLDGVTPGRVRGIAQNLYERGVRVTGGDET